MQKNHKKKHHLMLAGGAINGDNIIDCDLL